jgi:hypothetical protein
VTEGNPGASGVPGGGTKDSDGGKQAQGPPIGGGVRVYPCLRTFRRPGDALRAGLRYRDTPGSGDAHRDAAVVAAVV